jgi:hypothetical protein
MWGFARMAAARELLASRSTDVRQWMAKLDAKNKFVRVQKLVDLQLKQLQVSAAAVAAMHPPGTRVIGVSVIVTLDGQAAVDTIELAGTKA